MCIIFFIDALLKNMQHSCPVCCPAGSIFRALMNKNERDTKFTRSDFKNNFRGLYAGTDNDRSENKAKTSFCNCRHYAATELSTTGIQNCHFCNNSKFLLNILLVNFCYRSFVNYKFDKMVGDALSSFET